MFKELQVGESVEKIYLESIDEEEDRILQDLASSKDISGFIENFVNSNEIEIKLNKKEIKSILVALKYYKITDCVILKLVGFIAQMFLSENNDIKDAGSFIATALFGKDEFDAQTRNTFNEYKKFIKIFKKQKKEYIKYENFKNIQNQSTSMSFNDYKSNSKDIYDEIYNPIYLQKALKIMQENKDLDALFSVHNSFSNIISKSTPRIINIYASSLFDKLLDISNNKLYDLQFKNLAIFLKICPHFIGKTVDRLKTTTSDVLKAFIIYTLDYLHDISDLKLKIELHLKVSETILQHSQDFDPTVRSLLIAFVKKGMRMVNGEF
jgi:hypothetical protein